MKYHKPYRCLINIAACVAICLSLVIFFAAGKGHTAVNEGLPPAVTVSVTALVVTLTAVSILIAVNSPDNKD